MSSLVCRAVIASAVIGSVLMTSACVSTMQSNTAVDTLTSAYFGQTEMDRAALVARIDAESLAPGGIAILGAHGTKALVHTGSDLAIVDVVSGNRRSAQILDEPADQEETLHTWGRAIISPNGQFWLQRIEEPFYGYVLVEIAPNEGIRMQRFDRWHTPFDGPTRVLGESNGRVLVSQRDTIFSLDRSERSWVDVYTVPWSSSESFSWLNEANRLENVELDYSNGEHFFIVREIDLEYQVFSNERRVRIGSLISLSNETKWLVGGQKYALIDPVRDTRDRPRGLSWVLHFVEQGGESRRIGLYVAEKPEASAYYSRRTFNYNHDKIRLLSGVVVYEAAPSFEPTGLVAIVDSNNGSLLSAKRLFFGDDYAPYHYDAESDWLYVLRGGEIWIWDMGAETREESPGVARDPFPEANGDVVVNESVPTISLELSYSGISEDVATAFLTGMLDGFVGRQDVSVIETMEEEVLFERLRQQFTGLYSPKDALEVGQLRLPDTFVFLSFNRVGSDIWASVRLVDAESGEVTGSRSVVVVEPTSAVEAGRRLASSLIFR